MNTNQAASLARELMNQHGLEDWQFGYDRATSRAGMCNYGRRRISLSRLITETCDEAEVRNTILHEIAHALSGPGAGHGPRWRAQFMAIGGNGARSLHANDELRKAIKATAKYRTTCEHCGHEYTAKRRLTQFGERWCVAGAECARLNRNPETRSYLVWYETIAGKQVRAHA